MPWYDFILGNGTPEIPVYYSLTEVPHGYRILAGPVDLTIGLLQSENDAARAYANNTFNPGRAAAQQANAVITERIMRGERELFGVRRVTPIRIPQQTRNQR